MPDDDGVDSTDVSFPTYAELSQTAAWRPRTEPVSATIDASDAGAFDARYVEQAVLGVGGMGKVVLASDTRIGRDIAVKQLHSDRQLSPDARERFLREARVQGQLEHPSIVPVYDIDQRPDGTTFFTMRRVLGRPLDAILLELRRGAPSRHTQRELLGAFATVCLAIDYAHSRGVIHRDLKPGNLMLGDFGEVYVLDWGIARLVGESAGAPSIDAPASRLSMPNTMMGTPLYMAPEQMIDSRVGPSADVFSLGLILFEILTLRSARDPRALDAPFEVRAPELAIAPELETICVLATAHDPAQRYPSARLLQEALVRYLDGDRELEQRRQLAAGHARVAQEALAHDDEASRGVAMQQLVRALALDPTNSEHIAVLGRMMATPPRVPPPDVAREVDASDQRVIRAGSRDSLRAMLAWFLFVPVIYAIGVVHAHLMAYVLAPIGLAALLSGIAMRSRLVGRPIQYAMIAATLVGMMAVSRVFGPLVLGPTMIASYVLTIQVHPWRVMRRVAITLGVVSLALPMALELVGVLPSSYVFDSGSFTIVPQLMAVPKAGVIALLLGGSAVSMLLPALFIARVRSALSEAEARLLVQAWHLRRLGAEVMPPS